MGTPNGVKVTIMLEELLAAGHADAEYDAWLIRIGEGDQFGSGFVAINPNSKIPAMVDRSGPKPIRVFETAAILVYLAEKFGEFLPKEGAARAECLSWLFWQMGSAPYLGGGFGHFYTYAPLKIEYAIDRFAMETKRQLEGLTVHHSIAYSRQVLGFEFSDDEANMLKGAVHPLVRTIPRSQRKALYVASHASRIMQWPVPEGRLLLRDLIEHATQPEFVYRHQWRVGDLVIWDNRCTMHRARPFEDTRHRRELRRVTTLDM